MKKFDAPCTNYNLKCISWAIIYYTLFETEITEGNEYNSNILSKFIRLYAEMFTNMYECKVQDIVTNYKPKLTIREYRCLYSPQLEVNHF